MVSKTDTKAIRPEELGVAAYKQGRELGNFEEWLNSLPAEQRSKRGMFQMLLDSYKKGVENWADEHEQVGRVCVFIEDPTGKFYDRCVDVLPGAYKANSKKALAGLASHHKTMLINDAFIGKQVLPLSEDTVKEVNPNYCWTGDLLVVVVPYGFNKWLQKCGIKYATKTNLKPQQLEKLSEYENRFFICGVEDNMLKLVRQGSADAQLFDDFLHKVNSHQQRDDGFNLHVRNISVKTVESQAEG